MATDTVLHDKILDAFNDMVSQLTTLTNTVKQQSNHFTEFFNQKPLPRYEQTDCDGDIQVNSSEKVKLNVGGTVFMTTAGTLLKEKDSFFSAMLNGPWKPDRDGEYFIDRSPELFSLVLTYLRDHKTPSPCQEEEQSKRDQQNAVIRDEFEFYQIPVVFNANFFPLKTLLPRLEGSEWNGSSWVLRSVVSVGTRKCIPLHFNKQTSHLPCGFQLRVQPGPCVPPELILSSSSLKDGVCWRCDKNETVFECSLKVYLNQAEQECSATCLPPGWPLKTSASNEDAKAAFGGSELFGWIALTNPRRMNPMFDVTISELVWVKGDR
eukprot:TRINITY_DN112306_c0_g1_i1.p1 TRINITY_DN112306_c0_g1~~TRINITY_DN112306_c0_g1_i1.p1  ORF type:complete len:322 (-),score=31.15 TRINITY_DN112306_c0_g1_i1:157-1122(-)